MLILKSNNRLGNFLFDFVSDVEITSSWEDLTDTATMVIPKNVVYKKDGKTLTNIVEGDNTIFKRGDVVELRAGYGDNIQEIFTGFISEITPSQPLSFKFEDGMWILKQTNIKKFTAKNITLKELYDTIFEEAGVDSNFFHEEVDFKIGRIRLTNVSIVQVFQHIKKTYGLSSYMINSNTVYTGLAYRNIDTEFAKIFKKTHNIIDDNDLIYKRSDDVKIRLKVISIYPDNTKEEYETPNTTEGEQRTIYRYDLPVNELKTIHDEELPKLIYEGFRGSFETFLEPHVFHGETVKIVDPEIREKDGLYLVKRVTKRYGTSGGRQIIELDRKIG